MAAFSFHLGGQMPDLERASIHAELSPPFRIARPARHTAPFVWCSPHSGRIYPAAFLAAARLDPLTLRKSEDCFVDELVSEVCVLGAPLLAAEFPRAYLDVNREPYELDPALIREPLPDYANSQSPRVIGGLGTVPRIVADGEDIYGGPLPLAIALQRIELLYRPFHQALAGLIDETYARFGSAVLIDCHSMPSALMSTAGSSRPDFVLGDRFGASCNPALTAFVKEVLAGLGYSVHVNRPYAGGFITEHYGRPARGVHTLQLEVNRGIYLEEATLARTRRFAYLKRDISYLARRLFDEFPQMLNTRAAAE